MRSRIGRWWRGLGARHSRLQMEILTSFLLIAIVEVPVLAYIERREPPDVVAIRSVCGRSRSCCLSGGAEWSGFSGFASISLPTYLLQIMATLP